MQWVAVLAASTFGAEPLTHLGQVVSLGHLDLGHLSGMLPAVRLVLHSSLLK